MGLNDEYFTLEHDQGEGDQPKVKLDVFKDASTGDVPEVKEDVDFIAITQENDSNFEEEDMNVSQALEEACVRLRDLDLFAQRIRDDGGMSQQAALESVHLIPALITDSHPQGYYTSSPSRTSLSYALEAEEAEKQGIFKRMGAAIKAFLDRAIAWFKNFFGKFNGSKVKEEQAAKDAAFAKREEEYNAKIAKLNEELDSLKRAAAASNEEFERQLGEKDAAANAEKAASKKKIMDLSTQMRVLDDTKNREIAAALDQIDKLRRSEASSRSARIELKEKIDELSVLVTRSATREAFTIVEAQSKDIVADYEAFARTNLLSHPPVAKYLFGNGFQNRLQTVKRVVDVVLAVRPLADHLKKLTAAFENSVKDPAALMTVIGEIDFTHFTTSDQVFQKTEGFEEAVKGIAVSAIRESLSQVRSKMADATKAMIDVNLPQITGELEKMSQKLGAGIAIPSNAPNLTEIANSHRAMQAHVSKLLPYLVKGSTAQAEMSRLWMNLNAAEPSPATFVNSPEFRARGANICNHLARQIGLADSFVQANIGNTVLQCMATQLYTATRQ